jgi:cyclomaltodextrinase
LVSFEVPPWVRDAIFYQVFPDRFAASARVPKPSNLEKWDSLPTFHGFKGGDLVGVVERLDYLVDLGINALYFTPVFQSTTNHRYHTYDYYRVDPILGGDDALRTLLDEAHRRDMHVVLDGVFNHASRGFFQFNHILENGYQSPYRDWFHIRSLPLFAYDPVDQPAGYDAWWGLKALPKFNTATPAVREYLIGVAEYWAKFGIDGWRLDVPSEIDDDEFWREFRRRVKLINAGVYLVGEIWQPAERWLQGDQFDGVMNYQFMRACLEFFVGSRGDPAFMAAGYGIPKPGDASQFAASMDTLLHRYPQAATGVMLNLLDSHDTPRFITLAGGDKTALRMALLMLMTYPGAPSIFYGDEVGMSGGKDPDNRRAMVWDESGWDKNLHTYIRRIIALRKLHPALRWGAFFNLYASGDIYAFARSTEGDLCVVAFNAGDTLGRAELPVGQFLADGECLREVFGGAKATVTHKVLSDVVIAPRTGTLWIRDANSI